MNLGKVSDAIKVDNFDFISNLLPFKPGDVAFIFVARRYKDNQDAPDITNKYIRYLKAYWVESDAQLIGLKPEIVKLCEENNARAYITVNLRRQSTIDNYANTLLQQKKARSQYGAKVRASGRSLNSPNRPVVLIDIDDDNKDTQEKVLQILKDKGFTIDYKYQSPSGGLHVIVPDYTAKDIDWEEHGFGKGIYAIVNSEVDKFAILYANLTTNFNYQQYAEKRKRAGVPTRDERIEDEFITDDSLTVYHRTRTMELIDLVGKEHNFKAGGGGGSMLGTGFYANLDARHTFTTQAYGPFVLKAKVKSLKGFMFTHWGSFKESHLSKDNKGRNTRQFHRQASRLLWIVESLYKSKIQILEHCFGRCHHNKEQTR